MISFYFHALICSSISALLAIGVILLPVDIHAQCPPCTNQTQTLSVPLAPSALPYRISVEQAAFQLPTGLHSFAYAVYKDEWLLISGRTNGLHNVNNQDPSSNSFPVSNQNTVAYVVNPTTGAHFSRSLHDPQSGLSQPLIDLLSVTNALYYYEEGSRTLYLVGGYGIDTATNQMSTKPYLTAIDVPAFIDWVKAKPKAKKAVKCIRTIQHPLLQLTGGVMCRASEHDPMLLAFGQNFTGNYVITSNGSYSQQVRLVQILDDGHSLALLPYNQPDPQPTYRRRDLNVVPVIKKQEKSLSMSYVALSGVFTPAFNDDNPGAWTIPIEIQSDGRSKMLPTDTFAQAMNNYSCANCGLYSYKKNTMYTLLFGGISAALFSDGSNCNEDPNPQCNCCTAWVPAEGNVFTVCCNLPFTNDITTVEIDPHGVYRQYLMDAKFPVIDAFPLTCPGFPAPSTCDGAPLQARYWFGSNAAFIPTPQVSTYPNGVIALDPLKEPTLLGYIIGGIASTITDTNCNTDSEPSAYVFQVMLYPTGSY